MRYLIKCIFSLMFMAAKKSHPLPSYLYVSKRTILASLTTCVQFWFLAVEVYHLNYACCNWLLQLANYLPTNQPTNQPKDRTYYLCFRCSYCMLGDSVYCYNMIINVLMCRYHFFARDRMVQISNVIGHFIPKHIYSTSAQPCL